MFGTKMAKSYLDAEKCFNLWIETGSVYKTQLQLKERYGIVNYKTGKLASPMGVWGAASRYMLLNSEYCKSKVAEVWRANGEILKDQEWNKMLFDRAKYVFRKKRLMKYMAEHPELRIFLHDQK